MRKRRVIIFGSDRSMAVGLTGFFDERGYETVLVREPAICPAAGKDAQCPGSPGCGDLVVIRHEMPSLNAVELLAAQQAGRCGVAASNKAVIGPSLGEGEWSRLDAWGTPFFTVPLDLSLLEVWVAEREASMDLSRPVAVRRIEERVESRNERLVLLIGGTETEQVGLVNRSGCGACFRTLRRLMPNQMVKVRSNPEGPVEDAVVRWIRPAESGSYLVGLSFCA